MLLVNVNLTLCHIISEYLAHWLIRYRFNEELKKADTVNALEVVKMKKWNKYEDILGFVSNGIVPAYPYGPIG